jgi:hypothetical protein
MNGAGSRLPAAGHRRMAHAAAGHRAGPGGTVFAIRAPAGTATPRGRGEH